MSGPPFNYADFHGGLNTYDSYDLLADNEARDLLNVQGTTAGAIVKRGGLLSFAAPIDARSLTIPQPGLMIAYDGPNNRLVKIAGSGSSGTISSLKTGLTNPSWEWVRGPVVAGQGPSYGMNGVDTPQQWDEAAVGTANWTNATGAVAVPNGKYCVLHQNQVFVAGTTSNPSRLYWSAIADPTNWDPASLTGAGFMDFDPNDGDTLTGIGTIGPYLLVFKPRKTWVLIDPATATVRRLSSNIGCASHRSIAVGDEGTYFLGSSRGVYVTNGSKITPISDKIQPTIDQGGDRTVAAGIYFDSHYYLTMSNGGGLNDTTLDYDARLNSWWKHTVSARQWAKQFNVGGAVLQLYAAETQSSNVSRAFVPGIFQDDLANFTWSWSGPWQSPTFYRRRRFPTPYFRKRMRQIRYDGIGQVDLSLCKDFNVTPTLVASDIFGNSAITKEGRVYGQGVANVFSLVFSGTYPTAAQLNQYTLMVTDRKDSM